MLTSSAICWHTEYMAWPSTNCGAQGLRIATTDEPTGSRVPAFPRLA
ncbi:hypothetical protein ACFWJW_04165 [Streptomyces sp. NPDC127097]